jgi:sulfopyruvate decarboxylase alpha subunit
MLLLSIIGAMIVRGRAAGKGEHAGEIDLTVHRRMDYDGNQNDPMEDMTGGLTVNDQAQTAGTAEGKAAAWQDEVFDLLRQHRVTQFAYVPDAGHKILINRSLADPDVYAIPLTTEEEGVALIAGADLGGERAVLLMQSSGVGNCINMLSLINGGRFPFLTLISMRGDFGEGNPWQFPMGQATVPVLEAMGVMCFRADTPTQALDAVRAAVTMVFQAGRAVAVLFTQKLLGAKRF